MTKPDVNSSPDLLAKAMHQAFSEIADQAATKAMEARLDQKIDTTNEGM